MEKVEGWCFMVVASFTYIDAITVVNQCVTEH